MKHQGHKRRTANTHGTPAPIATHRPDGRKWRLLALLILAFAISPAVFALLPLISRHQLLTLATSKPDLPAAPDRQPAWQIGMLRPDGLRIIPSGRSDASHGVRDAGTIQAAVDAKWAPKG